MLVAPLGSTRSGPDRLGHTCPCEAQCHGCAPLRLSVPGWLRPLPLPVSPATLSVERRGANRPGSECRRPKGSALAATVHSRGENVVHEAALLRVFHVDHALYDGEELCEFAEGSTLCWGIASDVHHSLHNVVQHKGARVAKEFGIAKLHLRSQSVEHLVDLEVVVKDGSAGDEVAHRDALREHVPVLHIDS